MKNLLNILHYGIIGIGIGAVCTTISLFAFGRQTAELKEFAIWLFASMIIGFATGIMFLDKVKLLVATIIHFFVCFATAITAAFLCGYGDSIFEIFKAVTPLFLGIYIVIYAIIFFATKANEKAVNKALNSKE